MSHFKFYSAKDWSIRTLIPLLMLKLKQDPIREHLLDKILLFLDFDKNLHITFNKNKKNSDFFMGTYNNNLLYFENKTALLHKPICKGFFSDIIFK